MNKPEFPKARLIHEDFLPISEHMKNYRIKKVTKSDDSIWYYPEKKFLWFWIDISGSCGGYTYEHKANRRIVDDFQRHQKDKVEYFEPDFSQSASQELNPPPLKLKKTNS